jgi:hypothetical protein
MRSLDRLDKTPTPTNPYRSMVEAAVSEPVVAAAICWPGDAWMRPLSTPVRRLIRRLRGQTRWDDRLSGTGSRPSVVALTETSLLVFDYRVGRNTRAGEDLEQCLGQWPRDESSVEVRRTVLERSHLNSGSPYDSVGTERTTMLRLTATTPEGPLVLDLPVAGQPGPREFKRALR